MPFTFDGSWVPTPKESKPKGKIHVRKEKRGQAVVTAILNLPLEDKALAALSTKLKRQLGCGGTHREGVIEIQGDKSEQVKQLLRAEGFSV
jgi:translation initiation factor 1